MNPKTVNRRQFLRLAAVAAGMGTLTCAGLGWLMAGETQPETPMPVGFPDLCLGDGTQPQKLLVAYASAAGSTGGVAETIGRTLAESGAAVDVRPVQAVASLDPYRAVILGSAIHGGKWLPEAVDFLQGHQDRLHRMPTAFFAVGLMIARTDESTRKMVAQYLEAERALVKPVAEGRFVGAMFPNKYPFATGFGMRFFIAYCGLGLRGGDFRDLEAIRSWARNTQPLLIGEG